MVWETQLVTASGMASASRSERGLAMVLGTQLATASETASVNRSEMELAMVWETPLATASVMVLETESANTSATGLAKASETGLGNK